MTVSLTHETASASGSDFYVYVYDSSETLANTITAINGVDTSDNTSVTSGASYYILVNHRYADEYKYTLTVSF